MAKRVWAVASGGDNSLEVSVPVPGANTRLKAFKGSSAVWAGDFADTNAEEIRTAIATAITGVDPT